MTKLLLVIGLILTGSFSWAGEPSPFSEGTERVRLTDEERRGLLEYAETSKRKLERALDEAKGKSFEKATQLFVAAAKEVVIESYKAKPREELLLRYALNQALDLTYGVPDQTGTRLTSRGLLVDISNQNILSVILEDSIELALVHYQHDHAAVKSGSLVDLPYMLFAYQRLVLARKWLTAITEPHLQYLFSLRVLQHWQNTVLAADQLHRAKYAVEITKVDRILRELHGPLSEISLGEKIRRLRALMRKITDLQRAKLVESGELIERDSAATEWEVVAQPAEATAVLKPTEITDEGADIYSSSLHSFDTRNYKVESRVSGFTSSDGSLGTSLEAAAHARSTPKDEEGGFGIWAAGNTRFDYDTSLHEMVRFDADAHVAVGVVGIGRNHAKKVRGQFILKLLPTGGTYIYNAPLGFSGGGMRWSIFGAQAQGASKVDGIKFEYGATLEPNAIFGKTNQYKYSAEGEKEGTAGTGMELKTSVYLAAQLGRAGQLKNEVSYRYWELDGAGSLQNFDNVLELRRIAGSRYGASWKYSSSRLSPEEGDGQSYRQHLFGIGGEF